MLGFSLALVWTKGILLLPVLPALAAFLLMVTALTYQLQGWLASLMSNPRRRRTVIVVTTMIFVLVVQLPNLLNFVCALGRTTTGGPIEVIDGRADEARTRGQDRGIRCRWSSCAGSREVIEKHKLAAQEADRASTARWNQTARLANMVLPVGWLPLGVMAAAEGRVMPLILGLLGMS